VICVLYCLPFIDLRQVDNTIHRSLGTDVNRCRKSMNGGQYNTIQYTYHCLHQFLVICVLNCLPFIDLRHLFTSVPSDLCIVLSVNLWRVDNTIHRPLGTDVNRCRKSMKGRQYNTQIPIIDLRPLFTSVPSDLCIVLSTLHRFTACVYISSYWSVYCIVYHS
jgi:hypothetical protein